MSYHVGMRGLARIGGRDQEPHIKCDGCGTTLEIKMGRGGPPRWFLDGKAAPKWKMIKDENRRLDYCPRCKTEVTR